MLLANIILIIAGLYVCIKKEVKVSGTFFIRGRRAEAIGLALAAGGLLSILLPACFVAAGYLRDFGDDVILSLVLIAAAFGYVGYVVLVERRLWMTDGNEAPNDAPRGPTAVENPAGDPLLQTLTPLAPDTEPSLFALICLLLESGNAKAATLAHRLNTGVLNAAVTAAQARRADPTWSGWRASPSLVHLPAELPIGWQNHEQVLQALTQAAALERDRGFLVAHGLALSPACRAIETACAEQRVRLQEFAARWTVLSPHLLWTHREIPPGSALPAAATVDVWAQTENQLAELTRQSATAVAGAEIPDALKRLVGWPDPVCAAFLLQACGTPTPQVYVMHALALRTGAQYINGWEWEGWLKRAAAGAAQLRASAVGLANEFRDELAMIWLREQPDLSRTALADASALAVVVAARNTVSPAEFVRRWGHLLTSAEAAQLVAIPPPPTSATAVSPQPLQAERVPVRASVPVEPAAVAPVAPEPPAAAPTPVPAPALPPREPPVLVTPPVVRESQPTVAVVSPPPVPPSPSVWDEHIRPFLAANWYIMSGLLMVVAGASLLAYFTWDKSVFVRYLFLPALLAGFTAGMAELGLRLARRHEELRASGTFLLGGAVCLLPVNFMVLCRAGEDPRAAGLLLPALALYAALAGIGLWRWCGAVRPEIRVLLGLPLLLVNLLAVAGDMPGLREVADPPRTLLLPVSLTAAVVLMLGASNRFLRLVLTKELLEARLVRWFFGITMVATVVQVSLWRHFHLHITPRPQDYALAAILAGATLLRWERRACALRDTGAVYGGESFLGYAALFLGILMAAGNEWLRIVALLLVGAIWLVQAPRRPGVVHYWIGTTLCVLGGAAVGMLDAFPKRAGLNLLPALGLALALVAGAMRAVAGRFGEERLRAVAREIQPPLLLLTAIVAVLSQYRLHSSPWQTGLVLAATAVFFAVRATWEDRRDWLNIAAAAAGLALPYLGGADMLRYDFDANALGFGFGALAALWLATAHLLRNELWRGSGAFIATCYGVAGIVGLGLRLVLANRPDLGGAELAGGVLLTGSVGLAAWQLRSPVRGFIAVGVPVVLLPLFRVPAEIMPEGLHAGTGVVSAAVGLALMLGCFRLRRLGMTATGALSGSVETSAQKAAFVFLTPLLAATAWLTAKALLLQIQPHPTQVPFIGSIVLAAATLYAAALYFRRQPAGVFLFQASWPLLGAGIFMACDQAGCRGVKLLHYGLLGTGVALTALLAAEWAAARTRDWAAAFLVRPRLLLLACGSLLGAALVVVHDQLAFLAGGGRMKWLGLFVAAQLAWHGLRCGQRRFGAALFVLAASWLSRWLELPVSLGQLPVFLAALFAIDLALEFFAKPRVFVRALRAPFVGGATLLAPILALLAVSSLQGSGEGAVDFSHARVELGWVIAALLLAARAQGCAGFALPALVLGYLLWLLPCGLSELLRPWRVAGAAVLLGVLPFVGRAVAARWPRLLRGPAPQWPGGLTAPQAAWIFVPALALAAVAAAAQIVLSALGWTAGDDRWAQILAPFAAVGVFSLAGWYWRKGAPWAVAAGLLPVANLFAVSVLWGYDLLRAHLMPVHLGGIAALLTIAEFATVRWRLLQASTSLARLAEAAQWLHKGSAALAGLTLVLLGVNYLADPDLAAIPAIRFAVSGLLALGAGTYFRLAARRPENLWTADGKAMEALWHVALGVTIWCAALMVPALRTPHAALYALALPAAALWVAAEWFLLVRTDTDANRLTGVRFRESAAAFAGLVLVLYVFRLPFQMLLFPDVRLELGLYHTGAAAAVLMGLILIRVRGLGGAPWAALVGGLAFVTGVYFNVTWLPALSPFDFPMAGAWTAVGAAHLLILLSSRQSPLRSLIQFIGAIDEEEWHALRRQWGIYVTAATHVAVVSGLLLAGRAHSLETTPLLLALASVLVHQAVIGIPWACGYWALAGFEGLLALHFDFLLPDSSPGLIPERTVVWFLLVPWLAAAVFWRRLERRVQGEQLWFAALGLAALCAGHLFHHGPATGSGLLIALLGLLAALSTPAPDTAPGRRAAAAVMLASPLWLAYFGARWITGEGLDGFRSLLAGATALIGSGLLVRCASNGGAVAGVATRLAHEVVALSRLHGEAIARLFLVVAFAGLGLLTLLHVSAHDGGLGRMLALALVWGGLGVAWFREGHHRDGVLPYAASVLSLVGAWVVLRRLMFQHFSFWSYEYDVWLSLGAAIAFSAARRLVTHERPGLGRTMTGAVWLLPVLQCGWLLVARMDADLTLLVIGIQSMLFAWQGGGRRDSPYNAVATLGFVGFVCLLFWAKLDLRSLQAYTIPAGLGVLGLVWLFGRQMPGSVRNAVRLVTVLIMLGSTGYYALLDGSYSLGFHVTMLVLCLAMMALGPLLRVQLYLYLGFAGFATDLVALVVQQFRQLDRSLQMMGVGALLLLLGVAVVGGAIFYKTRHAGITARLAGLRARLGAWE